MKNYYLAKKQSIFTKSLLAILLVLVTSAFINAQRIVHVNDNDGNPLQGVTIRHDIYGNGNNWPSLGKTDANGTLEAPISSTSFKAVIGYTNSGIEIPLSDGNVYFKTSKATAFAKDCDNGNPVQGMAMWYKTGNQTVRIGTTDANGEASAELFPGDYTMISNGVTTNSDPSFDGNTTTSISELDFTLAEAGTTVAFNPTRVCIEAGGLDVWWLHHGTSYQKFNCNTYIYEGTHTFKFGNRGTAPEKTIEISGCSITGSFLKLVDENGNPMANFNPPIGNPNGQANLEWRYACNGQNQPWQSFQTDANGEWFAGIGCSDWTSNRVQVRLNQTLTRQNVSVNPVFMVAKVNVNLKNCDGLITDAPGGTVSNHIGFNDIYGTTGTTGTVSFYAFPNRSRPVKIKMVYNNWFQKLNVILVDGVNEIDFTTTAVTINHTGDIRFRGTRPTAFSGPTMDLLPGNYKVIFKTANRWGTWVNLSVSGCEINATLANLTLQTSEGVGLSGGVATYTKGGYNPIKNEYLGTTDANGNIYALVMGDNTRDNYYMVYNGLKQKVSQKIEANSSVEFNTILVTMSAKDDTGDLSLVSTYSSSIDGMHMFGAGTTTTSMEMIKTGNLVGFETVYNGRKLKSQNYSINPNVVFDFTTEEANTMASNNVMSTYPTRFTDVVTISYDLENDTNVNVGVYNMNGQLVTQIKDGQSSKGNHRLQWDGTNKVGNQVKNGLYIIKLQTADLLNTRRVYLNK